ncbi:restriction modification system DNA specificity subunit [gamma proteobacterium BDW918]|nr:restriction modification system DNA specificity subunit [gamma proteobacterium BDW918]
MSNPVPDGWKESSIGKITAKDSLFSDGDWVESKDQDPLGTNRLIQLADIGDGVFINKSSRYMNDEQFERLKCTELKKNDILIARMPEPLGRACLYPVETGKAATVVDVAILRTQNADHYWLMSAINSSDFRYQIDLNASGTTRTRIARGVLSNISILEPPLPEQQKIAAILSTVDDVIEKTRAQIDKLKDLKTGMMQELLTKGIGHTEFKDSPVGRIPVGWDVKPLVDVCERVCVGFVGTCERYYRQSGVPMIRTGNLKDGRLDLAEIKYVTREFHAKEKKSQLRRGDLLIARHGSHGAACLVPENLGDANCLNVVIVRADQNRFLPQFLKYAFNSSSMKANLGAKSEGSTQTVISTTEIAKTLFSVPSLSEQHRIVEVLSSLDNKIDATGEKFEKMLSTKKALMQDLLTGKVRVNVDNKESAVA